MMRRRDKMRWNVLLFLGVLVFSCKSEIVKLPLDEQKIYEYTHLNGPIIFEISANLESAKADYLIVDVESLTPRMDVVVYGSFSGTPPLKIEDN